MLFSISNKIIVRIEIAIIILCFEKNENIDITKSAIAAVNAPIINSLVDAKVRVVVE
jgi:hypothetical protein